MPDATLAASYPARGNAHVGRIRCPRRIRQWRGADAGCDACRVLSGLRNAHVVRIRCLRRIRQWRGADAGCDACRVLSGLRNAHVVRIRRPRRIRQWRGAIAGCDACRVLSDQGDCTCRADKAFTPHPPAVANYCLRKKSLYNIYKCAALQEKLGAPCCAPVRGL